MLYADKNQLQAKGIPGKLLFLIRFLLCIFPIGVIIFCIYWAAITGNGDWSNFVNHTILALNILVILFSVASFVFILFAVLSLFQKLSKVFTIVYSIVTIIAFIIGFVLLSFGNEGHSMDYLSNFEIYCGPSTEGDVVFPTPAPTPTPAPSPAPTLTFLPFTTNEIPSSLPADETIEISGSAQAAILLEGPVLTIGNGTNTTFCNDHWTEWSRRRYIRMRTQDSYSAFAGLLSPWIILFCIAMILVYIITPKKPKPPQQPHEDPLLQEHDNADDNQLLPDAEDPIFKDEQRNNDDSNSEPLA